jgi:hypothetical protein
LGEKKAILEDGFLDDFLMPSGNGAFTRRQRVSIAIKRVPGKNRLA